MVQPKELIYRNTYSLREVIADDYFKGVRFLCINIGDHPCSYICATQEFIDIHKDFYGEIPGLNVHGGVTHTGPLNKIIGLENYEGVWIGWNYGHSGDWTGHMSNEKNIKCGHTKYTTIMLITECKEVIKRYLAMIDKDKKELEAGTQVIDAEFLRSLGFMSIFNGVVGENYSIMYLTGSDGPENKWKVSIDFKNPSKSYVYNQNPRKRYEGAITTRNDLRAVFYLCQIPVEIK